MDFSTAMGHVIDAYHSENMIEWECDSCGAKGNIGDAHFDSCGDAMCPLCASSVEVSDGQEEA